MADLLPAGAVPLTVDFNYITNSTETSGTASTVSASKVGVVLGLTLVQVTTVSSRETRAVILINGQEAGLAIIADSTTPDVTSADDSKRYTRKTYFFPVNQRPILPPGATINVKIKSDSVTSLNAAHARVDAYEYTP